MEGFSYLPLAHESEQARIRLLDLEYRDDIVTLSLYSASLRDKPYYEAISYTWGDATKRKEIRCNGQLVTVPENLYDALRHLRHVDRVRTLWIDGICINQKYGAEKSAQIRMMPHIYEAAQTVLVWIGRANDQTERAFSEARRLAAAQGGSSTNTPYHMLSSDRNDIHTPFNEIAKDLFSIFQRSWFKRIWVIQEVSVCRKATVVCGPLTIDWDDLSAALFAVAVPGRIVEGPWRKTLYAIFEQRKYFDKNKRPHLSRLIVRHQDSLATKAEDKIYALLGLADDISRHQVTISYDITIEDVYKKIALSCLAYDQNLSILGSVEAVSTSTLINLPSWVPDWSVPRTAYALTFHDEFSSTPTIYTAARESQYVWKQPKSNRGLLLSGFKFDCIIVLGYADEHSVTANNFTKRQWFEIGPKKLFWQLSCERVVGVRSKKQKYATSEDILDVYWQTLCAGCTLETFNAIRQEFLSFDEAMKSLSLLHKANLSSSFLMVTFFMYCFLIQRIFSLRFGIESLIRWDGFSDRMVFGMGRRMARTSKGYIGLVPATTQPGDCVYLLKGGHVPFILREKGGVVRLIGEAYIHGIMKGEAFDEGKCEDIEIV